MITNRSLRFALCALLLMAPLAALSAQEMDDMMGSDEGFYISAAYGIALPGERELTRQIANQETTVAAGTGFGLLGGRIGVGYAVAGFRPEISVGYRTAPIESLTVKKSPGANEAALKAFNDLLARLDIGGTVTSIDLVAGVDYDIDTGSNIAPYIGVGGGMSHVTVKPEATGSPIPLEPYSDSLWALSLQATAGIGFGVMEDLTLTVGYRLTGTMEANFSTSTKTIGLKSGLTIGHSVEAGLRYSF